MKVTLKIDNCLDCPHHKIVPSVIFDSWDSADEDVVCTKVQGEHEYRYGLMPGRPVVVMERWKLREQATIPKWCPLIRGKKA